MDAGRPPAWCWGAARGAIDMGQTTQPPRHKAPQGPALRVLHLFECSLTDADLPEAEALGRIAALALPEGSWESEPIGEGGGGRVRLCVGRAQLGEWLGDVLPKIAAVPAEDAPLAAHLNWAWNFGLYWYRSANLDMPLPKSLADAIHGAVDLYRAAGVLAVRLRHAGEDVAAAAAFRWRGSVGEDDLGKAAWERLCPYLHLAATPRTPLDGRPQGGESSNHVVVPENVTRFLRHLLKDTETRSHEEYAELLGWRKEAVGSAIQAAMDAEFLKVGGPGRRKETVVYIVTPAGRSHVEPQSLRRTKAGPMRD